MARRQRNKPTDAERDARRNEDRERFEEAVSALLSSEGWEPVSYTHLTLPTTPYV